MKTLKPWPHLTVIAIIFALIGGVAAALWVRHEQKSSAATLPPAARVERVEGEVGLNNNPAGDTSSEWVEVTQNTPISVGDRIYTRNKSRAAIAFTGRNFARLDPESSIDLLSLSDRQTQIALREGSALFDVGEFDSGDLFEVATPYGAVDFHEPGLYEVGINENGSAWVSVLSGLAQVVGLAGSGQINKGEMLTLLGQTAADVALSRLNPSYAGALTDDYYNYRYPDLYDGRYQDYNAYLDDPFYYDPYRRYTSYQYANDVIPGLYDLDHYGDWQNVDGYGHVWSPRVDSSWAPYQSGYWVNDYPYGLTWISNEPWGYAPYHYGRWANAGDRWFWVPETVSAEPLYSPALVAFLPLNEDNGIGWVPLAPGDPYAPRYYNENWQPHYLTRADIRPREVININVPGAVSIVPWQDFDRNIDRRLIHRGDRHHFADARLTLDPLLAGPLRNAALRSAWGRGKIDLPPGIAKRLEGTRVIANAEVTAPSFRRDLTKRLRVERASEDARKAQFRIRDDRKAETHLRQSDNKHMDRLVGDAARGDKFARRQMQQLEQRQRHEQQVVQRTEQARGERVALRAQQQAQKEASRQQQMQQRSEQRQQALQQIEAQRESRQRAAERTIQERGRRQNQERQSQPKGKGRIEYLGPPVQVQSPQRPEARRDIGAQSERQAQRQAAQQQTQTQPVQRVFEPRQPSSSRQPQARPQESPERKQVKSPEPQGQRGNSERGKKDKRP